MPIPNADRAFVEIDKLVEYLLNVTHPVGGPKARWFVSLGFSADEPERLANCLVSVARDSDNFSVEQSDFGVKYIVDGLIDVPTGVSVDVRTVWVVETDTDAPRLVTAYPGNQT